MPNILAKNFSIFEATVLDHFSCNVSRNSARDRIITSMPNTSYSSYIGHWERFLQLLACAAGLRLRIRSGE